MMQSESTMNFNTSNYDCKYSHSILNRFPEDLDNFSSSILTTLYPPVSQKLNSLGGRRHKCLSTCGKYVYHLAIIDYLQEFNFDKRGESRLKIWVLRRPKNLISAVDPELYRSRFIEFMKNEVFIRTNLFLADDCIRDLQQKFGDQYRVFKGDRM